MLIAGAGIRRRRPVRLGPSQANAWRQRAGPAESLHTGRVIRGPGLYTGRRLLLRVCSQRPLRDTEAKAKTGEDDDKPVYAYTFSFSSTAGISDLKTLTFKIESVHEEETTAILFDESEYVGKGFQLTGILRSAKEFKNLQAQQGSTITSGLSNNAEKIGKGYTAFILPTVLWISAIALVIS
jgi:hypothetical protein